ncbi:MAG: energy-coupling factor ABC transporter ATP-binding protein [Rhodobacteraceae bacterium]|nr:energy-coupling factor ABC transporter ATP-binding protein [Paracoccaceae bacterium]
MQRNQPFPPRKANWERSLLLQSETAQKTVHNTILPLTLTGAIAKIRGKTIVGPINLTIGPQGFTIVMGPNGSGKTTLLRLMHGLQRISGGTVTCGLPDAQARVRQSYVFQTPIMMRRIVVDSIAYPLRLRGVDKKTARTKATDWAERVGLGHALDRPAPVLSGGEKQKLSLARALISGPDILFLDEPCANLDGRATREIETILRQAQAEGTRLVMATHDMGQARRLASDVVFMYGGCVHETGPATAFFSGPTTPQAAAFISGDIVE